MGKWETIRDKVFKVDNLNNQIHNGKLFIEKRLFEIYEDIDNSDDFNEDGELISKEDRRGFIDDYLLENGYEKDENGDILLHRFILRDGINRKHYNKLKESSNFTLGTILTIDHLQDLLQKSFDKIFESAYVNGTEVKDIELLSISEILTMTKIFIEVFDDRFNSELKKK